MICDTDAWLVCDEELISTHDGACFLIIFACLFAFLAFISPIWYIFVLPAIIFFGFGVRLFFKYRYMIESNENVRLRRAFDAL